MSQAAQQAPVSQIPQTLLDAEVDGDGLYSGEGDPPSLRDQLDPARPTLLVFLRHLGCIFCREMIKDIRIASEKADAAGERRYPRVVFFHTTDPDEAAVFFGRYWPGACAVSDPEKHFFKGMGLGRGSVSELIGLRVVTRAAGAFLKRHGVGRPKGDPFMMPGLFLVGPDGRVLHRHSFTHIGDHPDFDQYTGTLSSETPDALPEALGVPA